MGEMGTKVVSAAARLRSCMARWMRKSSTARKRRPPMTPPTAGPTGDLVCRAGVRAGAAVGRDPPVAPPVEEELAAAGVEEPLDGTAGTVPPVLRE
jgi:hypothetical protein